MAFSGDIEADNIGGFGGKVRVVALAPGLASRKVDLVVTQKPPDILDVHIAKRRRQQRSGPACKPFRWRSVQQGENPSVGRLGVDRLLAGSRLIFKPFKALFRVAMPPQAHNPRLNPYVLGNRSRAPSLGRQQDNPRPFQITLQCHRRAAPRFQHLAIATAKANFSCFGNHPDLES